MYYQESQQKKTSVRQKKYNFIQIDRNSRSSTQQLQSIQQPIQQDFNYSNQTSDLDSNASASF